MATAIRRADVQWRGPLTGQGGEVRLASGAAGPMPVAWSARVEDPAAGTSPEELLAAAQASCFAMALASLMGNAGHAPERMDVAAEVFLDPADEGGFRISRARITVRAVARGIDTEAFAEMARRAGTGCPVSAALAGNVDIAVDAALTDA